MSGDRSYGASVLVGSGILLSRIAGLIRQKVFAHYFSTSLAADAFNAAFRIPNMLQNLFGEGVLSASFIPVYTGMLAREREEEANKLAGAVISALALVAAVMVLLGVLLAPLLVGMIAPGFTGAKRELTIRLTQILFPGAALLVFSAWCLGILNSHRRFFMSYTAPVIWNAAMIVTLVLFHEGRTPIEIVVYLAFGSVIGSALQFAIQLPLVLRHAGGVRPRLSGKTESARSVLRNSVAAFLGRGVVEPSPYVDAWRGSCLPNGAVPSLTYAQGI